MLSLAERKVNGNEKKKTITLISAHLSTRILTQQITFWSYIGVEVSSEEFSQGCPVH